MEILLLYPVSEGNNYDRLQCSYLKKVTYYKNKHGHQEQDDA